MSDDPKPDLDYAPAAPPRWSGMVSAAVGAFSLMWLSAGLVIFLLSDDKAAGAKAAKYVLLACVPSSLVGVILGAAGLRVGSRLAIYGLVANALTLAAAAGVIVLTYFVAFS